MPSTKSKKKSKARKKASSRGSKSGKKVSMATTRDRHVLYQDSVQCVEAEIDFVDDTFRDLRGRRAELLREDFCGTLNTSCEWVRRRPGNRAIGVDLDADVLEWGRAHNVGKLSPEAQKRIAILHDNVLTVDAEPVDAVLAMNFSYFTFQTRDQMRDYYRAVREALVDDGIFFMDCYGGYESVREIVEKRQINKDFTYVWDQDAFNPITNQMRCYIHFHFRDGSKMKKAFAYDWRMWSLPEIREILEEAGFRRSTVYWEGTEEDSDEGNGVFEPTELGEADPSWVAYIVAEK
ncbi:MAG: class I SAM-dependent methyltransferase [Phycisphaerales bacterium]|nr:class I SAM-dependent methyltransferase [Phycisphaerales bacterium]